MDKSKAIRKSFFDVLKSIATVVFRRRTFLLGWDGVALSLAYVGYFSIKFIYVWDNHRKNGNVIYPELRKKLSELWDDRQITCPKSNNLNE